MVGVLSDGTKELITVEDAYRESASKAKAGEVLVSLLLREIVEPSGEFEFGKRPPGTLKGFKGKHILHAVRQ